MSDVKSTVANTIVVTFIALLFLFAFTWIIFDFNSLPESLKETWAIVSSLFGGLATLSAAYIGSKLYNDWRAQEKFNRTVRLHDEAVEVILKSTKELNNIKSQINLTSIKFNQGPMLPEMEAKILVDFNIFLKQTIITIQDLTHDVSIKIALDYMQLIKDGDKNLIFVFNTIIEIKEFVQKIAHDHGINNANRDYVVKFIESLTKKLDKKIQSQTTYQKD